MVWQWTFMVLCLLLLGVYGFTIDKEDKLRKDIFTAKAYDVNVRPENVVIVNVMFNLMTINELNIRDQKFKVTGWFTLYWEDHRLSWNNTGFGGIKFLFATQTDVWRPSLVVSNSIENIGIIEDQYTPFRILDTGRVVWEPLGIYEVHCEADITYYPFDDQECFIILQSWSYNLREVNITIHDSGINLREYRTNGEWDLVGYRAERDDSEDAKGDEYAQVRFFFKLTRKSQYYWLNVLLPVIVNSVLTALVFLLPAESGEKMGYSLTVLLSFAVLLTLVADKIPSTSINTAIIVVYFSVVLVLAALAVLLSTIVLDFYFEDEDEPIPEWMKIFFKYLGKAMCYRGCAAKRRHNSVKNMPMGADEDKKGLRNKLDSATSARQIDTRRQSWVEPQEPELTWKIMSKILDIFFFRVYFLTIVLSTIGFLTAAATHTGDENR